MLQFPAYLSNNPIIASLNDDVFEYLVLIVRRVGTQDGVALSAVRVPLRFAAGSRAKCLFPMGWNRQFKYPYCSRLGLLLVPNQAYGISKFAII